MWNDMYRVELIITEKEEPNAMISHPKAIPDLTAKEKYKAESHKQRWEKKYGVPKVKLEGEIGYFIGGAEIIYNSNKKERV